MREVVIEELTRVRLKLSLPKSRLLAVAEGVPFCGMRFFPGLRPRILGATKRRFEKRRNRMRRRKENLGQLRKTVFGWYQYSLEANAEGLRKAYSQPRGKTEKS